MVDARPVANVIGNLLIFLASLMLVPGLVDLIAGLHNASDFLESALITGGVGLALRLSIDNADLTRLNNRQAYVLTVMVWAGLPLFACLPFALGAPGLGLIGGCSGSSSGALSVFRVQVAWAAVQSQIARIQTPDRIAPIRYAGRRVEDDTINALMLYVTGYILIIGVPSMAMSLTGVDMVSSLFAIWTALGNIGDGYGPMLGDTGTFRDFPDAAKWLMMLAMLLGRLGLLAVLVVALPSFWRA